MAEPDSSPVDPSADDASSPVFGEGFVRVGQGAATGAETGQTARRAKNKVLVAALLLAALTLTGVGLIVLLGPSGGPDAAGRPDGPAGSDMRTAGEGAPPPPGGSAGAYYLELQYLAAMEAFNRGDQRRALELATSLDAKYSEVAEHVYFKAVLSYYLGDRTNAFDHALTALKLDGKHAPAMALYGLLLHEEGRGEEAIPVLELAVQINGALVDSWYCLGASYRRSGQVDKAEKALGKVLELSPSHAKAGWELAQLHDGAGNPDKGLSVLQSVVEAQEGQGAAHRYLSMHHCRHGRLDAGLEEALRSVEFLPGNAKNQSWLSEVFGLMGNWKEAAAAAEEAVKVSKDETKYLLQLGICYSRADELMRSNIRLKKVLDRDPAHYDALTLLGHNLARQELFAQARLYLEHAAKQRPDVPAAWRHLVPVYEALNQASAAEEARKTVARLEAAGGPVK